MAAIWKDYIVNLGTATEMDFRVGISNPGTILYTGRAYRKPGENSISIKINDIIANQLSPGIVSGITGTTISVSGRKSGVSFYVDKKLPSASSWTGVTSVEFSYDWSYRDATGRTINTAPTLKTTCQRYQLVYVDAFGSWETFVIEGNVKVSDNITRHSVAVEYNNAQAYSRGKKNYANELVRQYTISTHHMTDTEAAIVPDIIESTQVYLYDADAGTVVPVVITDTSAAHKTHKTSGGKLSQYTFTAELAQDMVIQ